MIFARPIGLRALLVWSLLAMGLDIGVSRITYGTILPALSRDLGLDYVMGGAVSATNLAAYLVGTLVAPSLGRRFGMRSLARWGHILFAAGIALGAAADGVWVLAIARAAMGFGSGVGLLALFVLVFAATPPARRGAVSAFVWSGIGLSIVLSAVAAPVLLQPGGWWRLSFFLPALLGLAVGIMVGRPVAGGADGADRQSPLAGASAKPTRLRPHAPLALAYLTFGVGYIAFSTFVGTKLAAEAAPMAVVVAAWLTLGIGALAGSAVTASLLSGRFRHLALLASAICGCAGAVVTAAGGPVLSIAGSALVGLGLAATPAIVTAYARARTGDADYPRVFGFATAGLGIGQLAGPILAGLIAERFGSDAIMAFSALGYGVSGLFALFDLAGRGQAGPTATGVSGREPHSAHEPS